MKEAPHFPDRSSEVVRLVPDEPFPPYSFVPGRFPHPESDPAGHSFGIPRTTPPRLDPARWPNCRTYLRGLDLFNGGYYWESHVEFESLWLACGRRGPVAGFLKGLIRLAAAGVKQREDRPEGVQSHARGAARHWQEVARSPTIDPDRFLGFRLPELLALAERIQHEGWPMLPPLLVPIFPPEPSSSPAG